MKNHPHPSDSSVQRRLESVLIERAETANPGWARIAWSDVIAGNDDLPDYARSIKPDAVWRDNDGALILGECYTRVGALKGSAPDKLMADITKLRLVQEFIPAMRIVLVMPAELARQLRGWVYAAACKVFATVIPIAMTAQERAMLAVTVKKQGGSGP
jgi:hypothetical protein